MDAQGATPEEEEKLEALAIKHGIYPKWVMKYRMEARIEGMIEVLVRIININLGTLPEALLQKIYSIKDENLIETIAANKEQIFLYS